MTDHWADADRVAHRGAIVTRVWADVDAQHDRLGGLRRIGIAEISKKGHEYLTVVVDHDTLRLVWAAPACNAATVRESFDLFGPERCARPPLPRQLEPRTSRARPSL